MSIRTAASANVKLTSEIKTIKKATDRVKITVLLKKS